MPSPEHGGVGGEHGGGGGGGDAPSWLDLGPAEPTDVSNDERSQQVLQAYYDELAKGRKPERERGSGGPSSGKPAQRSAACLASAQTSARRPPSGRASRAASIEPTQLFLGDDVHAEPMPHGAPPMAMA